MQSDKSKEKNFKNSRQQTWTLPSSFQMLRPCRTRVTFLGEDKYFWVSDEVALSKSYAPPVNDLSSIPMN